MKTTRKYVDSLNDILTEAHKVQEFVADVDFDAFAVNGEKVRAVVFSLLVIGEAAKAIPRSERTLCRRSMARGRRDAR